MRLTRLFLWCGVLVLGACTGHHSEYASQGYPDGTVVGSTRDVYTATNGTDRLTPELPDKTVPSVIPVGYETDGILPSQAMRSERSGNVEPTSAQEIADLRRVEANLRPGTARYDPTTFTPEGIPTPVAAQSRVLRIWVAPWRDALGDTIVAGYVFANVDAMAMTRTQAYAGGSPNYLQSVQSIEARTSPTGPPSMTAPIQRVPSHVPDRAITIPVSAPRPST